MYTENKVYRIAAFYHVRTLNGFIWRAYNLLILTLSLYKCKLISTCYKNLIFLSSSWHRIMLGCELFASLLSHKHITFWWILLDVAIYFWYKGQLRRVSQICSCPTFKEVICRENKYSDMHLQILCNALQWFLGLRNFFRLQNDLSIYMMATCKLCKLDLQKNLSYFAECTKDFHFLDRK